jgi:DNA-binding transcriptional MocR family regulator
VAIELDADIQRLLFEHVASYEQLEALLLLHTDAGQFRSVSELAAKLRIDDSSVAAALEELTAHRLLEKRAGGPLAYRYAPAEADMLAVVDRLAAVYNEQRLEIIRQMSANAIERLRSSAARTFADAFLLRGRKP